MKYFVEFFVNEEKKAFQLDYGPAKCSLSDEEVKKKMDLQRYGSEVPSVAEIHVAKQVLDQYPDATKIYVVEQKSGNSGGNGAGVVIAFILAIVFAPLIIALGMNGHFLLKGSYADRGGAGWKKFKKIYIPIGFIMAVVCIALIVVGAVLSIPGMVYGGLYGLFGGDILYFILSLVLSKKYKGAVDVKAENAASKEEGSTVSETSEAKEGENVPASSEGEVAPIVKEEGVSADKQIAGHSAALMVIIVILFALNLNQCLSMVKDGCDMDFALIGGFALCGILLVGFVYYIIALTSRNKMPLKKYYGVSLVAWAISVVLAAFLSITFFAQRYLSVWGWDCITVVILAWELERFIRAK